MKKLTAGFAVTTNLLKNSLFPRFSVLPSSSHPKYASIQLHQQHKNQSSACIHSFITRQFSTISNLNRLSGDVPYFPYGEADFEYIRRNKQFYVDKTHLIPLLERTGTQLFFVRPPRWGKSLLLSTLASYYNISNKDQFDELFGGLWIGDPQNQTPLKNEYHVLRLDFSVEVDGSPENIKDALHKSINADITRFLTIYDLEDDILKIISADALVSFDNLVTIMLKRKSKLMVLIDEYDRFANKLMFENPEKYKLIVEGKRGDPASSPIRSFFERLKKASASGLADFRSLIVGITPIALADASGYNVAENISLYEEFGDLVGFNESDLRMALSNIGIINDHQNNAISIMKQFYNGYHFPGSTQPLFNPTLSMYFLKKIMRDNRFKRKVIEGKDFAFKDMTDENTKISENVFAVLGKSSISIPIIQRLTATNSVQPNTDIVRSFKLREIMDPPKEDDDTDVWDNTLSFMYYHGMLTLSEDPSSFTLSIPNEIAKLQYLEQLKKSIPLKKSDILKFIDNPTEDNLHDLLWHILLDQQTIYDKEMPEGGLQASIESALRAICLYNNPFKKITAEKRYLLRDRTSKFADLVLETEMNVFIIEFKRVRPQYIIQYSGIEWSPQVYKTKFAELSEQHDDSLLEMEVKWVEDNIAKTVPVRYILDKARQQVNLYGECEKMSNMAKTIHKFVVVQVGWPLIVKKVN